MEEDEDTKIVFGIEKRICRCCLNSSDSMVYAATLREAFAELAGITVNSSDGLPQWVCIQCVTLLRKAVRFRRRIQHTDNVLRDYLARCAPFPMEERDPELSKHATHHLAQTQTLQFSTDTTKHGFHKVLQHEQQMDAADYVECKIEYDEPEVKLEHQYSDIEDDMPLLELRNNKEDGIATTASKPVKRKKDGKSRKKKKKYENESESHDESENDDENITIFEPLESNDPLVEITDLEETEISHENQKRLPKKNHDRYLRTYEQFLHWKNEKNISAFNENVFLTYFQELDIRSKPPTLLAMYFMLKTTMLVKKGIDLEKFAKLKKFLKDRNKGYCVRHSRVFTKDEVDRFLKTAPDDKYLSSKVVLILGVCGGCVTTELYNLTIHDFEIHANLILVKVKEKNDRERSFIIPENYSEPVKKYMNLRPKDYGIDRFFVHYKVGLFSKMVVGRNKIAAVPQKVATFLKLQNPKQYTMNGVKKTFQSLFDPKKGTADELIESESDDESENFENDSETANNANNFNDNLAKSSGTTANCNVANSIDASINYNDNVAYTSDTIANFSENVANSSDATANYNDNMANSNHNVAKKFIATTVGGKIWNIPEKSRKQYIRAYELFEIWMKEKNIDRITEDITIEYFKDLTKEFRPSSLWNLFSMLRKMILTKSDVDIKKFEGLKQFLRSILEGFERRTSKVFTADEIDLFLSSAPDYNYLAMKVVLILGISGACLSKELYNLTTDNVKLKNHSIVVKIKEGSHKLRCFRIPDCYYEYVKRYMDLRPKNLGHNKFFFAINDSNYTKQLININTISFLPREVASFLVLPNPESYNKRCFKKTSAALFGTDICTIESYDESESGGENHNESDDFQTENEQTIVNDNHNEIDNKQIHIDYGSIVKKNIKHDNDNFENYNTVNQIQIEIEPIIEAQNIKQEIDESTIQDNNTYIQENSTEIQENSADNSTNLNPTQRKYFDTYKLLQTWMIENDIDSYSETTLLSYFQELSKTNKPSSLSSRYSMLKWSIQVRNGIDISKYDALREFIKESTKGYQSKKSKTFTMKEIEQFLKKAPDFEYLHWKVALIFGISGACTRLELLQLTMENVKIRGKIITVKILSSENKRKFFIKEEYADYVKKYMDSRPEGCNGRFFLLFRKNRCSKQFMGRHSISDIPIGIAKYLNLPNPEEYTGQCFRRTSLILFGKGK